MDTAAAPLNRVTEAASRADALLDVAPDVACLQQPIVNLYFYGRPGAGDREWVLIDAGLPYTGEQIRAMAARRFGPNSRPSAIVLTHGHFDHVGGLPGLADEWQAPIYAHDLEMPYLTGRSAYPPPDPAVGGGGMAFLSRLYPRGPYDFRGRLRTLPPDHTVPGMPGWRWIHTPGHTAGHIALFRDSDRTLIAGDAFVTTKQESAYAALAKPQFVHRPPAYYTVDWAAAGRSVAELARLRPEVAATGHGLPMRGETMRRQLDDLVRDWDTKAVPSRGRYVNAPAVMDERGVVRVPPPVFDPQLLMVAGLGAVAVCGLLFLRASTDDAARSRTWA